MSGSRGSLRERESKADSAVFEWLGARACATNAVRVPGGVYNLVAESGVILFVSGFSNLIHPCIPAGLEMVCT